MCVLRCLVCAATLLLPHKRSEFFVSCLKQIVRHIQLCYARFVKIPTGGCNRGHKGARGRSHELSGFSHLFVTGLKGDKVYSLENVDPALGRVNPTEGGVDGILQLKTSYVTSLTTAK